MVRLRGSGAMWDNLRWSPNNRTASTEGIRMINPSHTCRYIFPQMNVKIYKENANTWEPFVMARYRDGRSQGCPV